MLHKSPPASSSDRQVGRACSNLLASLRLRFSEKYRIDPEKNCWVWTGARTPANYPLISHQGRMHSAAWISLMLHQGYPPGEARHACGRRDCVNPLHLQDWPKRNLKPGTRSSPPPRGIRRGEDHPVAKLTDQIVREIRSDPRSLREVAIHYGITPPTVWAVRHRRAWKHVL